MRALELGLPLIRSTNNGITAITDHRGQIIAEVPQFETAVLKAEVTPTNGTTWYREVGTWPLYIWVAMCAVFGFIRRRT